MGLSLKGEHLKRYRDIAALFMKYGRSDLVNTAGLEGAVAPEPMAPVAEGDLAEHLAADLEEMGPTFVKVGQLLSTRADLLPLPYMEALARLQDKVGPFPFLDVEAIVSAELGVRLSKAFAEFEPEPVEDYSTSRVLTIDYIRGEKITRLSPLVRTEIDGAELAEQVFRAYLQQILVDGFVHADPHPGNVFLTDDDRVALLDLGMVARISPGMQEQLLRLLLAVSEGRAEDAGTVAITMGVVQPHFDETGFRRDVAD